MRDAWVASSRQEAEQVYGQEVMTAYRYYWQNGLEEFRRFKSESDLTLNNIAPDRLIWGGPEECVGEFHRWSREISTDYFLLRLRHAHSGGPSHKKIMETISLFGESLIPTAKTKSRPARKSEHG